MQQILPTPDDIATKFANGEDPVEPGSSEILWPLATTIRECDWSSTPKQIEPDEFDEFQFHFVLPPHVRAVQVYSHLENVLKPGIGWNTTTPYYALAGARHGKTPDTASDQSGTGEANTQANQSDEEVENHEREGHQTGTAADTAAAVATTSSTPAVTKTVENEAGATSQLP